MSEPEGHPLAHTNDRAGLRAMPRRAIARAAPAALAVLATAAVIGIAWAGLRNVFLLDAAWMWAAVAACALLFAAAFLLIATRRNAKQSIGRAALSQQQLEGIIRSTTEAIITIDSAQRVVMLNPMAERVFGCPASEATGAPLSRFIPERYRSAHEALVRDFGKTGVSDRQMAPARVLHGLRADGREFPIEASISQTGEADGKLYTVVLRDVTDRVKAEAELRQSREDLRALSANLQQVREVEKSRIARELHDDLGQTLSALKMDVSALETRLAARAALDDGIAAQLARMLGLIDRNIASLRRIAARQRPVMLDDLGLPAAIDWLIGDFTQRHGIGVNHAIDTGDLAFSAEAATAVFRIIEEALGNIARHAHASHAELSLRVTGENCVLRVGDNGIGASALPAAHGKSFGLIGVRERVNALGGRVFIDSMPENGFVLTVILPRETVREKESQP